MDTVYNCRLNLPAPVPDPPNGIGAAMLLASLNTVWIIFLARYYVLALIFEILSLVYRFFLQFQPLTNKKWDYRTGIQSESGWILELKCMIRHPGPQPHSQENVRKSRHLTIIKSHLPPNSGTYSRRGAYLPCQARLSTSLLYRAFSTHTQMSYP